MTKRKTPYVSTNITVEAREVLTSATLRASVDVGRRVPQSAVIIAALKVAEAHRDAFLEAIEEGSKK